MSGIAYGQMLTGYSSEDDSVYVDPDFVAPQNDSGLVAQEYAVSTYDYAEPRPLLTRSEPSAAAAEVYRQEITPEMTAPYRSSEEVNNAPVDFEADNLTYNQETQTVEARGNVELIQAGRILRADMVSYNQATDTVVARGNVVLTDTTGDVYFADEFDLTDQMSQGFVTGIQSYMADGGRLKATSGERKSDTLLTLRDASYTPCDCGEDEGSPTWQIKADELTVDEESYGVCLLPIRLYWRTLINALIVKADF